MVDPEASLEWFLANRHAEIPVFVVLLEPTASCPPPGSDEFNAVLREHFLYWWELEERGLLLGAGPLAREDGVVGMAILRASTREDAERLAAEEPFATRGFRRNTVHTWQLNEGTFVPVVRG
jgi:uncharacterized protein